MLGADRALQGAQDPTLHQGEHPVDRRQHLMSGPAGGRNRDARMNILLTGGRGIGGPAVGDRVAARLDAGFQERGKTDRAGIRDQGQAGTAEMAPPELHTASSTFPSAPRPGMPGSGPPR